MKTKRFTKTIAFRVSEAEYELLDWYSTFSGHKNVSVTVRALLVEAAKEWHLTRTNEVRKLEAAAKRAAKKAANADA